MSRYLMFAVLAPRLLVFGLRKDKYSLEKGIFDLFMKMGGIYVKFLQVLVQDVEFFDQLSYRTQLESFNEAPPSKIDVSQHLLLQLGLRRRHIQQVEPEPFATGSFANVYRAQLSNGQPVVLKVLRPLLRQQLFLDRLIIMTVARLWGLLHKYRSHSIVPLAKEFTKGIASEADYLREVNNARLLEESYSDNPSVMIPKTYEKLSTRDLIVQDYVDGVLVKDLLAMELGGPGSAAFVAERLNSDIKVQIQNIGTDMLLRLFEGAMVHGDIHPGNIMLLPDNKIALIDFGQVGQAPQDRVGFFQYIRELSYMHTGNLRAGQFGLTALRCSSGRLFKALEVVDRMGVEDESLLTSVESFLNDSFNSSPRAEAVRQQMVHGFGATLFDEVVNPSNRFSMDIRVDGLLARRAVNSFCSIADSFDLYEIAVHGAYEEAVSRSSQSRIKDLVPQPSIDEALETLGDWLENVQEQDQLLYRQLRGMIRGSGVGV